MYEFASIVFVFSRFSFLVGLVAFDQMPDIVHKNSGDSGVHFF